MKKRSIALIIVIMTISLLGISLLQYHWITTSVKDLEQRFDDNVYDILDKAKEYLERESEKNNKISDPRSELNNTNPLNRHASNLPNIRAVWQEANDTRKYLESKSKGGSLPEKIDKDALYTFIHKEMEAHDIKAEFHFGIWSKKNKSFVIIDDYYTVEENSEQSTPAFSTEDDMFHANRSYSRDIFGTIKTPRAEIIITFPQKRQIIWKSALRYLLLGLLFIGLILACFIYTITVIYRQKKLSEMKTDFINNMTHEFKTPIATISLATDSIASSKIINSPEKIARFTKIIKQENKRMLGQVEKVLQMALLDRNKYDLKLTDLDMKQVIFQAVENTRLQVEQKGGTLTTQHKAENYIIQGDQTHIGNTIYNLLDNANKYTPENPNIIVHTRNVKDGIEVTVEDNGIGLTKEDKKHIFEKFYRVHTGNLHDVKGFGLGLSYVKNIVDAHNGSIDVKSELNKGSKFILFFPFEQNNA